VYVPSSSVFTLFVECTVGVLEAEVLATEVSTALAPGSVKPLQAKTNIGLSPLRVMTAVELAAGGVVVEDCWTTSIVVVALTLPAASVAVTSREFVLEAVRLTKADQSPDPLVVELAVPAPPKTWMVELASAVPVITRLMELVAYGSEEGKVIVGAAGGMTSGVLELV
jgi:hypothetical protein